MIGNSYKAAGNLDLTDNLKAVDADFEITSDHISELKKEKTANVVYSLKTKEGNFIVDGVVVRSK